MIPYNSDIWQQDSILHELLITDGTVTVSGTHYSVNGASVTITDDLIDLEAFELDHALCSGSQLQFGRCESGNIKFTMYDNIPSTKGKTLNTYIIPNQDASLMVQLGVFKVHEDKLNSDRTKREVTAYDKMWDINNADVTAWYNSVLPNSSSSMTLQQFRNSFLNYFGVTVESTVLANDLITIRRTIEPETLSGADVLRAICEINGVFGTITNEGKFRFVELSRDLDSGLFPSDTLYPANDLYPQDANHTVDIIDKSYYINIQFEDYLVESITGLTIRTDDQDVGVTVGTSSNKYVITNNFLVYGYDATALTSVANNILPKIAVRYYRPCVINALGNPLREVGDGLRIKTTYRGVTTYVLERKLTGVQSLRDTYTAQGEQYYNQQLNTVQSQYKQLSGRTLTLKADIDGISAELTQKVDNSTFTTYTEQTATQISSKADAVQLDGTVQGTYAYQTAQAIGLKADATELDGTVTGSYAQITATEIASKVSTTDYNGSEIVSKINQTSDTINAYVTKTGVVGDLNTQMSSYITITANQIAFGSDGTLVIDTTNFELDANGNATFKGDVTGATISGGTISGTTITSTSGGYTTTISGGEISTNKITVTGGSISGSTIVSTNSGGTSTTTISGGNITSNSITLSGNINMSGGEIEMINGAGLSLFHGGISVTTGSGGQKWLNISGYNSGAGSSTFANVAINGVDVHINYDGTSTNIYRCERIYAALTTNDNYIDVNSSGGGILLEGHSGSKIIIDSSNYTNDIVFRGNTDIGTSSNTVVIKGKTCKWVKHSTIGNDDYVLVEA